MKTVLVIDPGDDDRLIACTVLRNAGYATKEATNPVHALAILRECHIDAIVSAFELPAMACSEFVQRLEDDPATRHIPVVIASNFWDLVVEKPVGSNVAARIHKPVTGNRLTAILENLIGGPVVGQ